MSPAAGANLNGAALRRGCSSGRYLTAFDKCVVRFAKKLSLAVPRIATARSAPNDAK
jgi:hypothetical protein